MQKLEVTDQKAATTATPQLADPIVPPLTPDDTGLFPSQAVSTYVACVSPWIELGSKHPVIATVSRQVLNLEVAYASFCGVRTIIVPGPCGAAVSNDRVDIAQYARAIQEALKVGGRTTMTVQLSMCPEPPDSADSDGETLGMVVQSRLSSKQIEDLQGSNQYEFMTNWDAWNEIRSVCNYSQGLGVGKSFVRTN